MRFVVLAALAVLTLVAAAAAANEADQCTVKDRSEQVTILVCPADATRDSMSVAGKAACADSSGICNAWIWLDPKKAPARAPRTDADLDKADVAAAVAVWVHNAETLLMLGKVNKGLSSAQ